VIVPRGAQLDVEAVLASAGELLADFKVPQYVVVRHEALPRNPGGKLLKPALRSETVWGEPLR
ncbi:MAG: long-chain fatty acid--CoA ligase, partial [Actinomycetota bacterium]|nr:long-chain fatty acid--CoA ligase [Actinomycetota bacterium]